MKKVVAPLAPLALALALTACAPQVPAPSGTGSPATPASPVGSPATPATPVGSPAETGGAGGTSPTPTPAESTTSRGPSAGQSTTKRTLPHEGQAGWEKVSSGTTFSFTVCNTKVAATNVTDSLVIGMAVNESGESEGWATFPDAAAAQAYVDRVTDAVKACKPWSYPDDKEHRWVESWVPVQIAGKKAIRIDTILEMSHEGSWVPRPGGAVTLLAVDGHEVVFADEGSEGVVGAHDPSTKEVVGRLQATLGKMLA